MPIKSNHTANGSNWTLTEFEETVPMSTYLVALVLADYKCRTGVAHPVLSKNVDISVCTRPDALSQLDYAFENTIKLVEFFEKFYDIKYPLPKLGNF